WPHAPGKFDRDRARAAADVEDALTCLRVDARDQLFGDRRQQDVLHGLAVGPVPAGDTVPECDLIGVAVMPRRPPRRRQFEVVPVVLVFLAGALASGFCELSLRTLPQGSIGFCSGMLRSERL